MENNILPQLCPFYICYRQDKDKNFQSQKKTIFEYLKRYTSTASIITIPQKLIYRYKRDLDILGLLNEVEKKLCKLLGFLEWCLTTNPNLFPKSNLKKVLENGSK
ncbi:MAG TPA: hypothetical protein VIV55_03705 [Flavobacterium sp.]